MHLTPEAEEAVAELCAALIDAEPDHAKRMEYLQDVMAAFETPPSTPAA